MLAKYFDYPPWLISELKLTSGFTSRQKKAQADEEYFNVFNLREGIGYYYVNKAENGVYDYIILGNSI